MLRKESEAVSEGNGLVHQEEKFGTGQPALADEYRELWSLSKQQEKRLDRITRLLEQLSECLKHEARQPRFAVEADGPADTTKTHERTEGAATAVQAMRGDCFSARRVEPGPNPNSTSFGVKAEPPTFPCRDDVVVECGAAASESCLPSMEMGPSTAAGGLVPTGEASTTKETNFNQPPLRFCSIEETDLKAKSSWTSVPSTSNDSSSVFQERNLSATPYYRRVVDTKSGQNRAFDPGGSQGHLRACPFLRPWRALVFGEVLRAGAAGDELQRFFGVDSLALWNKTGYDAVPGQSLAVEGGSRLHELDGRIRGHDVMATRDDWKLGANACRGVSWSDERFWSQQLDGNSAKRTPASGCLRTSRTFDPLKLHITWYAEKCTRVLLQVVVL